MHYAQDFTSPWPGALDDMREYVALTHLSLGSGRAGSVRVKLSRRMVAATELQPHVNEFRRRFATQLPSLKLVIAAEDIDAHRVDIFYR